jgi:hypothetical protein
MHYSIDAQTERLPTIPPRSAPGVDIVPPAEAIQQRKGTVQNCSDSRPEEWKDEFERVPVLLAIDLSIGCRASTRNTSAK